MRDFYLVRVLTYHIVQENPCLYMSSTSARLIPTFSNEMDERKIYERGHEGSNSDPCTQGLPRKQCKVFSRISSATECGDTRVPISFVYQWSESIYHTF